MTLLSFAFILLLMLVAEKLLLMPLHLLAGFHLPTWISGVLVIAFVAWLIGE